MNPRTDARHERMTGHSPRTPQGPTRIRRTEPLTPDQEAAREVVFARAVDQVLFRVHGKTPLAGLTEEAVNRQDVESRHVQNAEALGTGHEVREMRFGGTTIRSNFQVYNNEKDISVGDFVAELRALGFRPTNAHFERYTFKNAQKGFAVETRYVSVICFSREGEAVTLPESVEKAFTRRAGFVDVYANRNLVDVTDASKGEIRRDCVELRSMQDGPARKLGFVDGEYEIVG